MKLGKLVLFFFFRFAIGLSSLLYLFVLTWQDQFDCLAGAGAVPLCVRTVSSNCALRILSRAHSCGWCLWLFQVRGPPCLSSTVLEQVLETLWANACLKALSPACLCQLGVGIPEGSQESQLLPCGDVVVGLWFTSIWRQTYLLLWVLCVRACGIIFLSRHFTVYVNFITEI